jgi:hypothetical protein
MPANTIVCPVDGRSVTNRIRVAAPRPTIVDSTEFTSRWSGNRFVLTFTVSIPEETTPRRYERAIWLNPDGALSIEDRRVDSTGTRTVVYRQ